VVAEEYPPAAYQDWLDDVPFSYVAAFLLKQGEDLRLSLQSRADSEQTQQEWPNGLNFLRHFLLATSSWQHAGGNGTRLWQWTRGA